MARKGIEREYVKRPTKEKYPSIDSEYNFLATRIDWNALSFQKDLALFHWVFNFSSKSGIPVFDKTLFFSLYSSLDLPIGYMVLSYLRNETYYPENFINLNFERDPNYLARGSSFRLLVQHGDLISYVKDDTGLVVKSPSMCHVFKAQAPITGLALSERFVAIKSGIHILLLKICENSDIVCLWFVLLM